MDATHEKRLTTADANPGLSNCQGRATVLRPAPWMVAKLYIEYTVFRNVRTPYSASKCGTRVCAERLKYMILECWNVKDYASSGKRVRQKVPGHV